MVDTEIPLLEQPMQGGRIYQLDVLRALLMVLGVVFHSAFVFSGERWLISEADSNAVFEYIVVIINTFRMPAFFLISGFLFSLVLARQGVLHCLLARLWRIGIPLCAAGILLNIPQFWLFEVFGPEHNGAAISQARCSDLGALYRGCWLIHLWFLSTLGYFFIIGAIAHSLHSLIKVSLPAVHVPTLSSRWWLLTVVLFSTVAYLSGPLLRNLDTEWLRYLPLFRADRFFVLLPFFLAGFFLYKIHPDIRKWASWSWIATIILALSWTALLMAYSESSLRRTEFLYESLATTLLFYGVAFQTTIGLFAIAVRWRISSTAFSTYLTDASYTIYLTHHILVFISALYLTSTSLSSTSKFFLVVTFSLSVSWLFHHFLVTRSRLLRLLFNGRPMSAPMVTRRLG